MRMYRARKSGTSRSKTTHTYSMLLLQLKKVLLTAFTGLPCKYSLTLVSLCPVVINCSKQVDSLSWLFNVDRNFLGTLL